MMYTALNLRPYLKAEKALNDSYWFLAISYFNVVLPTFIPRLGDVDILVKGTISEKTISRRCKAFTHRCTIDRNGT